METACCPKCREKKKDGSYHFCSGCGHSLKNEETVEESIENKEISLTKTEVDGTKESAGKLPRNKHFKMAFVLSIVMLLLPYFFIVVLLLPIIIFQAVKGYKVFQKEETNKWQVHLAFILSGIKLVLLGLVLIIMVIKPESEYEPLDESKTNHITETLVEEEVD